MNEVIHPAMNLLLGVKDTRPASMQLRNIGGLVFYPHPGVTTLTQNASKRSRERCRNEQVCQGRKV